MASAFFVRSDEADLIGENYSSGLKISSQASRLDKCVGALYVQLSLSRCMKDASFIENQTSRLRFDGLGVGDVGCVLRIHEQMALMYLQPSPLYSVHGAVLANLCFFNAETMSLCPASAASSSAVRPSWSCMSRVKSTENSYETDHTPLMKCWRRVPRVYQQPSRALDRWRGVLVYNPTNFIDK